MPRIDKWPCASINVEFLLWAIWFCTPWSRASNGVSCIPAFFLQPSHCCKGCIFPATDTYPSGCTMGRCCLCHCWPTDPTCSGSSHSCSPYSQVTTHHCGQRDHPHSSEHRRHCEPGLSSGPQNYCVACAQCRIQPNG